MSDPSTVAGNRARPSARSRSEHTSTRRTRAVAWISVTTLCAAYAGGIIAAAVPAGATLAAPSRSATSAGASRTATAGAPLRATLIHPRLSTHPRHHQPVDATRTVAARQARRQAEIAARRAPASAAKPATPGTKTARANGASPLAFPSGDQSFDGIDNVASPTDPLNVGDDFTPNPSIDVSPQYVVQAASPSLAVFSKSGTLLGATELEDFFSNNGTTNTGTACDYDVDDSLLSSGQVLYDTQHARWIVAAEEDVDLDNGPFYECIAVSTSSDPLGAYNLYPVLLEPAGDVYPGSQAFGLWADGLYMVMDRTCSEDNEALCPVGTVTATASNVDLEGDLSPQIFAFNTADLEAGGGVRWQTTSGTPNAFNGSGGTFDAANEFQLIPATQATMTGIPTTGTPEYFMSANDTNVRIDSWQWTVNWNTPASSVLSARSQITVASSGFDTDGLFDEPSPGNQIANNFNDLLPRIRYTNFAGVESIWTAWSDVATSGCTNNGAVDDTCTGRIHWFQLAINSGTRALTLGTQNVYAPDTLVDRFLPSLSIDKNNDMLVGYSVVQGRAAAAVKVYPGLRWAGRLSTDTAGTTGQAESSVVNGTGYQVGSSDPSDPADTIFTSYGSFSSMTTDPDGCEFWYSGEYLKDQSPSYDANSWSTRIASTHYTSCTPSTLATSVSAVAATGSAGGTATLTARLAATATGNSGINGQTVSFSVGGNPVGTAVTNDAGVATLPGVDISAFPAGTASGAISASFAASGEFGTSSGSGDLLATGATTQTITFASPPNHTYGDADFAVSASSDSGNTVTFTATGACSVTGTTVHIISGGSCSITAAQAGDATYAPATPVVRTITIARATQTISFTGVGGTVGLATAETASASSTLAVYLTSSSSTCATVSPTILSGSHAGTCTLVAHQDGNANYAPVTLSQDVSIAKGTQTGTLSPSQTSRRLDQMSTLGATWSSGLATTSYTATNTAATITASPNGAKETGTTVTITTSAAHGFVVGESVTVSGVPVAGYNGTFTIATVPTTTTFTYTDTSGLAASGAGSAVASSPCASTSGATITVLHAGPCTVVASQAGNADFNSATVSRAYTVTIGTQTITFSPATSSQPFAPDFVATVGTNSGLATGAVSSTTPSVCTISGTTSPVTVHPVALGSCILSAAGNAGSVDWTAKTASTVTYTITKASQTISFGPIPNHGYGDPDFTVGATASSGDTVTFTASGQCSMADAITVHVTGAGSCTITAAQAGDANYNAATSVPQTFSITKANQTIAFSVADHTFGDPDFTLSATATSGLTVSFSIDTGNCSLSGSTLHITGSGSCVVRASQGGDTNNNAAPDVVRTFTIAKASQTITFGALADHTYGDADFTVSATSSAALPVSFGAAGACTVSGSTVHISGAGSCTITASQPGNADTNPAADVPQSFTVNQAAQTITFPPVANHSFGDPDFEVSATASSGLIVSFDAAGECTVTGTTVHLTGSGSCTVTAHQAGDSNYTAAPDVPRSIGVTQADQTISFATIADHAYGDSNFGVSATASSGLTVTFAASGSCSLADPVTVQINSAGTCSVTASQGGDDNYNAAPDVAHTFSVAKADQSIAFAVADHTFGDPDFTLSATATSGLTVALGVDTGNCTLTGSTLHITGSGNCVVRASQGGDTNNNAATDVVRTFTIAKASQTITFSPISDHMIGDSDFAVTASASSGLGISFTAVGSCTVSGSTVHIVSLGSCTVTASQSGDSNDNPATDVQQSFDVNKRTQTISFPQPPNHAYGDPNFTISASASSGLTVTFTASGPCTVTGTSVHITGGGSCSLTAEQAGDGNDEAAPSVTDIVTISGAPTNMTLSVKPHTVAHGHSVVLTAHVRPFSIHPTGTVNFYIDGSFVGSATVNAKTTVITATANQSVGKHAVTAAFVNTDGSFAGSVPKHSAALKIT